MTPSELARAERTKRIHARAAVVAARKAPVEPVCPNVEAHYPGAPDGYHEWFQWAQEMNKTHRQKKCFGCLRMEIWVPR